MKITSGNIQKNDIEITHENEVFYDCEERIEWPTDEFHDCIERDQAYVPSAISLQEDVSRLLYQLVKITLAYEASRFSNRMVFNMGWGIPLSVLNSSWEIYRAITGKASLGTALVTSLPLFISAISSQADRLTLLADQIKQWLDKYLTVSLIEEWTSAEGEDAKLNGYLLLGILALTGHYYCQHAPQRPPQRRYLRLPPMLAELFTRICLFWQLSTLGTTEQPAQATDGFGRLALGPMEKERQVRARFLARSWARQMDNNQQHVERLAERYYGISRISEGTSPSVSRLARPTGGNVRPCGQNSLANLLPDAIAAARALPWPSLGFGYSLLPLAQAAPEGSQAGSGPAISAAKRHVIPKPTDGDAQGVASDAYGIEALNHYLVDAYPAIAPSGWRSNADRLDEVNAYLHAVEHYWRHCHHLHCLANIMNILTQLRAEQRHLAMRETAVILHQLGLHTGHAAPATLHLFDINGYQATDMMVMRLKDAGTLILYLPKANRHFWVFGDKHALRQWIIDRCADKAGREEIAAHFALNERMDGPTIFGKWGVDRWLTHIKTYAEHIFQDNTALTLPWHEVIAHRQRARAGGDAAWLTRSARETLRSTGKMDTAGGDDLFARQRVPYVKAPPASGGVPNANSAVMSPACAPRHGVADCAFALLGAVVRDIVASLRGDHLRQPRLTRQDIIHHLHNVSQALTYWRTMPPASPPERRVIDKLALAPAAYRQVRPETAAPPGKYPHYFHISLTLKNGQHKAQVLAIHMHHAIVPVRYNEHHKFYEIYDINRANRAGYPVYLTREQSAEHWRFGYMAELFNSRRNKKETPMDCYRFISVRLYQHIRENLPYLRCYVESPGPINSKGLSHDVHGHTFLKTDGDYIKISKIYGNNIYLLGSKGQHQFKVAFNKNSYKYLLNPNENSLNATIDPPTTAISGLNQLFNGPPLFNRDLPIASDVKQAIADATRLLEDLLGADNLEDLVVFYPTFYSSLQLSNAAIKIKKNAVHLLNQRMKKMVTILQNLTMDNYSRLQFVPFKQTNRLLAITKRDPLKQVWINSRYEQSSTTNTAHADAHFCRFACGEIAYRHDHAVVGNVPSISRPGTAMKTAKPGGGEDFTTLTKRLLAGNLTPDEVGYLISRPEINEINNAYFLTDRKVAKLLLVKMDSPRISLIMDHADLFSRLLMHLHQKRYAGRDARPFHAWTGMLLISAALQDWPLTAA